jgi:multidrug resistance efflux pump
MAAMPRNLQAELEQAEAELERRQLALNGAQAQEQRIQASVKSQELVVNTLKAAVQKLHLTKH